MSNPKPSDALRHSPASVWLIWNGPSEDRHILCAATTEDAAHLEIGRRVATGEGAPIQNPTPEEIVVIGAPDPRSMEALIGKGTKAVEDVIGKLIGPGGPLRGL